MENSPSWVLYLSKICAAGVLNLCDNDMTLICTIHLLVIQGSLETGYTCLDFSHLYYKFNYRMLKITLHKKYFKEIIECYKGCEMQSSDIKSLNNGTYLKRKIHFIKCIYINSSTIKKNNMGKIADRCDALGSLQQWTFP